MMYLVSFDKLRPLLWYFVGFYCKGNLPHSCYGNEENVSKASIPL